jgi:hypothetical protein
MAEAMERRWPKAGGGRFLLRAEALARVGRAEAKTLGRSLMKRSGLHL